ncbi:hypothetical protein PHYC_03824 [Phycisphaerales bacterium]|nr:hypothetical protein PHYC_03824 [Phycisphaerales bacterium]
MTTNFDNAPLKTLTDAAAKAKDALGLKYRPEVIRDEATAFRIAATTKAGAVILGEGAFWVVCLADAERLAANGYEYAPTPSAND